MNEILDYAPKPAAKRSVPPIIFALTIGMVTNALMVLSAAAAMDNTSETEVVERVSVGYWIVNVWILARRRRDPTRVDLGFIAFGYLAMFASCEMGVFLLAKK